MRWQVWNLNFFLSKKYHVYGFHFYVNFLWRSSLDLFSIYYSFLLQETTDSGPFPTNKKRILSLMFIPGTFFNRRQYPCFIYATRGLLVNILLLSLSFLYWFGTFTVGNVLNYDCPSFYVHKPKILLLNVKCSNPEA